MTQRRCVVSQVLKPGLEYLADYTPSLGKLVVTGG
jgi:hypothetical protein